MEKKGIFVIYGSKNGRDNWFPVKPEDVPEWVKDKEVLGHLVNGNCAQRCDDDSELIYRAEVVLGAQDEAKLREALETRELREAEQLLMELPADQPVIEVNESIH